MNSHHPPHDIDPLGDVVISEPRTPINYSPTDLPHAEMVIKYKNLGAPWTSRDGATLLETLSRAASYAEEARKDRTHGHLRPLVVECLDYGHSIIDLPDILGESLYDVVRSLSNGNAQSYWAWTPSDWLEFESGILLPLDERPTKKQIAADFGLSQRAAAKLISLYGAE